MGETMGETGHPSFRDKSEKQSVPPKGVGVTYHFFEAMPLKKVGQGEVAALHHRMRDMPSMANRAVWVLSRLFVLAETWEMVPHGRNPSELLTDATSGPAAPMPDLGTIAIPGASRLLAAW